MPDADVVFVVNPVGWHHEFRAWDGVVGRHMAKVVIKEERLAIQSAPGPGKPPRNRTGINYSTTGMLESMITPAFTHWGNRELEGQVRAFAPHARMVHEGTRAHRIPRTGRRPMTFFWHRKGRVVTLTQVNHPGTAARPFLAENLLRAIH